MTETRDEPFRSAVATLHAAAEQGAQALAELHATVQSLTDAMPDDTEGETPCS